MASHNQKPWWELEGKLPPYDAPLDSEREHLRSELARAHRSYLTQGDGDAGDGSAPSGRQS
jgi:hypothetical protein